MQNANQPENFDTNVMTSQIETKEEMTQLDIANKTLAKSTAELRKAKRELEQAQIELKETKRQLDVVTDSLSEIYGSWSWISTKPLRNVSRSFSSRTLVLRRAPYVEPLLKYGSHVATFGRRMKTFASKFNERRLHRALVAEYSSKRLDREADNFVLYRIIGNDLLPRHKVGQSRENVQFILENESDFKNCEKRWVINRIVDKDEEAKIIALLEDHKQPYLRIPFDIDAYRNVPWEFDEFQQGFFLRGAFDKLNEYDRSRAAVSARRRKNNYVMNNNGARNAALRDGRERAKWVLPWDGNCFLTEAGWAELADVITDRPFFKYFVVPMARVVDNEQLLDPKFQAEAREEPQVVFRRDAKEQFNEAFPYGRRPKVELLWRLCVPGNWDKWVDDPWDPPRPQTSVEAAQFSKAGWVARLYSGRADLETTTKSSLKGRGLARIEAITAAVDHLDEEVLRTYFDPGQLTAYDETAIAKLAYSANKAEAGLFDLLLEKADAALARGSYSVVDKTTLPPSGDPHDYWHPAPYWWPNPDSDDGLPFVRRDGERVPGTQLFEPGSEKYDRSRLQRLFEDVTLLALAWRASDRMEYAEHAARHVSRWFIDPETRMNPHLRYAQVIRGLNDDEGQNYGVIEMKDMYFFLDAVRLLCASGALSDEQQGAFTDWLREYLDWLLTSVQGRQERQSKNNHGTCYDLQVGAIAAYLGNHKLLRSTLRDSNERLFEQFAPDGSQPHELGRTQTAHYVCFNLQSWVNLGILAECCGLNLWDVSARDGRSLKKGFEWLAPFVAGADWKLSQIEPFNSQRYWPLCSAASRRFTSLPKEFSEPKEATIEPLLFPHDGAKPFWMLGT